MPRVLALALALALPMPLAAQDQTLADIRQELSFLFVELQSLKRELSTTTGVSTSVAGDTLQRVDLIERELQSLTARTEELEFRIDRVVSDGTNRVGDLEFRLCELEPDCDIAGLGETPSLGGVTATAAVGPVEQEPVDVGATELAIGEQADYDLAIDTLEAGSPRTAVELLEAFLETYPGGPLTAAVQFYLGEALSELGRDRDAGLAYLASFSGAPDSGVAPDALLGLGMSLGRLEQLREACTTLDEVGVRFPGSPLIAEAEAERARLGCS